VVLSGSSYTDPGKGWCTKRSGQFWLDGSRFEVLYELHPWGGGGHLSICVRAEDSVVLEPKQVSSTQDVTSAFELWKGEGYWVLQVDSFNCDWRVSIVKP
jgi:hypothetical protein